MKRRGFLGAILAAGVAPAAVGSGILMPVKKIWHQGGVIARPGHYVLGDGMVFMGECLGLTITDPRTGAIIMSSGRGKLFMGARA